MTAEQAAEQWREGHHLFFVFIQGIVINLRQIRKALEADDLERASILLHRGAKLLVGSSSAMKLAANIPPERYMEIRQSMSPPAVPQGFSGLWSIDHEAMLDEIRKLKPLLERQEQELAQGINAFKASIDIAYSTHSLVCEKFVGDGPSLAMRSERKIAKRSALQLLASFHQRVLKMLPVSNQDIPRQ